MDVVDWLRSLGLERYEAAFRDNEINERVLPSLTQEDLKEIGIGPVGHRRLLLEAIAALHADKGGNASSADAATTSSAPSISPEDRAERRQVTVMFCDLVGSTALSTRMDPEDLREVISAYQNFVAETVGRFGGFVARYMGDGVLVYFGYPQAHEDDAERGVRAGLALVQAVPKLTTVAGVPLQVRVGIATGLVVVGDLFGEGASQEHEVVGETPNLAARLQALAEPGAVVISSSTRRLTGGFFDYRDLGTVVLKGFAETVPAWQALGASATESRFEALRASTTPLVGRGEEIDLLLRRWEQAKGGEGSVVLLAGEPGIGKSRIAETILERLSGEPHTRLRQFCSPHHQDTALYPSIAQLERAAGFRRDDTDEQRLTKLEAVLALAANDLGEAVPLLAGLLSIPTGDRYPALDLTPQKRKEKTLRALVAQVEGLAARQPVLLVVEDAHWADPTSLELFELIVERASSLPLLAIVTFRTEFVPPWVGRPQVTLISLNRLPRRLRAEMIGHVTGGKVLPQEIADQITDRTDGVPLFIEELTKSVVESGLLVEAGDRYVARFPVTPLAIPTSLQESLLARLDRLAPISDTAQIAAALGRQFSHELISAVAAMPRQQLDDALAQLVNAELIFRRGTPPDAEYTFKHALVQDAAYGTMLKSQRVQMHARIVKTFEREFPEMLERSPDVLAYHCTEARTFEKAIDYWLKSARMSLGRSAGIEAQAQLEKAATLLQNITDQAPRQQFEARIQIELGNTLLMTKGFASPDVATVLTKALGLLDQSAHPIEALRALGGLCNYHLIRSEAPKVLQLAEPFLRRRADPLSSIVAHYEVGTAYLHIGKFEDAKIQLEKTLSLYEDESCRPIAFMAGIHVRAFSLIWLSLTYLYLGKLKLATETIAAAVSDARSRLHPFTLVSALLATARFFNHTRNFQGAVVATEEGFAIATEQRSPYHISRANILKAVNLVEGGRPMDGISLMDHALVEHRKTGANFQSSFNLSCLAKAFARADKYERALDFADQAIQEIERTGERWWAAEAQRIKGTILLAATRTNCLQAEDCFRAALKCAHSQKAKFWELRAAYNLASLWHTEGRDAEARKLLAPIHSEFTDGIHLPDLNDARQLLDRLRKPASG